MSSSVLTNDVSFAYTDSGPANADYVTIFAVHGMGYGKGMQTSCPRSTFFNITQLSLGKYRPCVQLQTSVS